MTKNFGEKGTRYQENCERCGRYSNEVDNDSGCCRSCHAEYVADREYLEQSASHKLQKAAECASVGRF